MAKKLTHSDIHQFKTAAWDLKKSLNVKLSIALDMVARENNYENWSILMNHFNSQVVPDSRKVVFEALKDYVNALSDYEISQLFLNGTVWIYLDDVANDEVTQDSFQRLGGRNDGITHQYSRRCGCIVDMDGMPSCYILKSELVDDDAIENNDLQILTIEEARGLIVDSLGQEIDSRFDSVLIAIDDAKSKLSESVTTAF